MKQYLIIAGLVATLIMGGLVWRIHDLNNDVADYKQAAEDANKRAVTCNENDIKTESAYNVLAKNITGLDHSFDALDLVRQPVCYDIDPAPQSKHDEGACKSQSPRPHAVSSRDLLALAREGEEYRLELLSCQDYARTVAGIK